MNSKISVYNIETAVHDINTSAYYIIKLKQPNSIKLI